MLYWPTATQSFVSAHETSDSCAKSWKGAIVPRSGGADSLKACPQTPSTSVTTMASLFPIVSLYSPTAVQPVAVVQDTPSRTADAGMDVRGEPASEGRETGTPWLHVPFVSVIAMAA